MARQPNSQHHPTSKPNHDLGESVAPEDKIKNMGVRGGTGVISFSGVRANFLRSFSSLLEMRTALEKDGTLGSYYLINERHADDADKRDLLAFGNDLVGILSALSVLDAERRMRIFR